MQIANISLVLVGTHLDQKLKMTTSAMSELDRNLEKLPAKYPVAGIAFRFINLSILK